MKNNEILNTMKVILRDNNIKTSSKKLYECLNDFINLKGYEEFNYANSNSQARFIAKCIDRKYPLPEYEEVLKYRKEIAKSDKIKKVRQKALKQEQEYEKSVARFRDNEFQETPNSPIEEVLDDYLKKTKLVYKRQAKIGKYFADFYFSASRLIVECDGHEWHNTYDQMVNDLSRQNYFVLNGYKVLRYPGRVIYKNPQSIIDDINKLT